MPQYESLIVVKAPDHEGLMNIDEAACINTKSAHHCPSVKTELPALCRYYSSPSIRSSFPAVWIWLLKPSSADDKNEWSYASASPYAFM